MAPHTAKIHTLCRIASTQNSPMPLRSEPLRICRYSPIDSGFSHPQSHQTALKQTPRRQSATNHNRFNSTRPNLPVRPSFCRRWQHANDLQSRDGHHKVRRYRIQSDHQQYPGNSGPQGAGRFRPCRLYQVETKALTRAVRRNAERFPGDFKFQLAAEDSGSLRSLFDALKTGRGKHRK
jgi:hypothetical protein